MRGVSANTGARYAKRVRGREAEYGEGSLRGRQLAGKVTAVCVYVCGGERGVGL